MKHKTTAVLLCALFTVTAPAWAQQPNTPPPAVPSSQPAAEEPNAATPASDADDTPAADANRSPYDYQSSEEISEDLSVSFPVDI